jgi:hypothetical protein
MPLGAPLQPTGKMHPILRESLAAEEAAENSPILQASAAATLQRNKAYRLSQEKKQPQD